MITDVHSYFAILLESKREVDYLCSKTLGISLKWDMSWSEQGCGWGGEAFNAISQIEKETKPGKCIKECL
jgi:hypothetical protein